MATTQEDIRGWLNTAKRAGERWVIIVCDSYDHTDYPVGIEASADFWERYAKYDGCNMQRIMEVYDLNMDIDSQLKEHRANHAPPKPGGRH